MVSSGDYSDYSVSGVFTSRERAEKWMDACGGKNFNDIKEMPLDEGLDEIERGLKLFGVEITKSGDILKLTVGGFPSIVGPIVSWSSWYYDFGGGGLKRIDYPEDQHRATVWVWADDEKHAVKVANERRIAALAEGVKST
jgi:hypothetical protein